MGNRDDVDEGRINYHRFKKKKQQKKPDGNACWDLAYLPKLLKLWCWTTREMSQMLQKDDEISLIQGILITYHTKNGQIIL